MNLRNRFITIVVLISILTIGNSLAFAQVIDGPIAVNHLKMKVKDLLYLERFDELEKMANEFRTSKAMFPHGGWKLHRFYNTFENPKNNTPEGWERFLSKFGKWLKKYPNSVTARTAAAHGWEWFGWHARGIGFADKVTEESWQLFHERINKAYSLISAKPNRTSDDCPERYYELLNLATYQSFDKGRFEALFNEATTFQPDYHYYYFAKAHYLLPRWHGKGGDTLRFALETNRIPPEKGGSKTLYMDIVMTYWDDEFKSFDEGGVSRELVKQGLIESLREFPSSPFVLNYSCLLACIIGDRKMARELFEKIGDHPYMEAWTDTRRVSVYTKWKDWVYGKGTFVKTQKHPFPNGSEDFRQYIALAKDGDAEAQYQVGSMLNNGELVGENLPEAEKWLTKAAKQGYRGAQVSLAMMYFNGHEPIEKDFNAAGKWYYTAAMQGDSNASSSLGQMYKDGFGLEKDLVKAYVWYSQVTQWQEPKVKEIAAILTPEQLARADAEAKKIRGEIRNNMELAEIRPIDPSLLHVPEFKLAPQIKYEVVPQLKLPTSNLLDGVNWQLSGGATFDGKTLSIKNQGEAAAQMKVISSSNGCVLIATRLRHARPEAIVPGTPFLSANMTDGNFEGQRVFMGLLAPPPNNRKEGPWYKTDEIRATRFDGVKLRFGTAGKQEGSSTEIYDTKVIIFPSCKEANKAGEEYLRQ